MQAFSRSKVENVWVTRADGSLQCDEKETEVANDRLTKAGNELTGRGVQVIEAKKRHDGKMRAQACGFPTGNETSFLIPKKDVATAAALGFTAIP